MSTTFFDRELARRKQASWRFRWSFATHLLRIHITDWFRSRTAA